jgi:hypothetical protein
MDKGDQRELSSEQIDAIAMIAAALSVASNPEEIRDLIRQFEQLAIPSELIPADIKALYDSKVSELKSLDAQKSSDKSADENLHKELTESEKAAVQILGELTASGIRIDQYLNRDDVKKNMKRCETMIADPEAIDDRTIDEYLEFCEQDKPRMSESTAEILIEVQKLKNLGEKIAITKKERGSNSSEVLKLQNECKKVYEKVKVRLTRAGEKTNLEIQAWSTSAVEKRAGREKARAEVKDRKERVDEIYRAHAEIDAMAAEYQIAQTGQEVVRTSQHTFPSPNPADAKSAQDTVKTSGFLTKFVARLAVKKYGGSIISSSSAKNSSNKRSSKGAGMER